MSMMTQFKNWMAGLWVDKKTEKVKDEIIAVVEDIVDEAKDRGDAVKEKVKASVLRRARDARGRFLRDDPATEGNEAFEEVTKDEK